MARTRQTARKSTGGKAPRKMVVFRGKGGKGLGKGGAFNAMILPSTSTSSTSAPSPVIKGPYNKPLGSHASFGMSTSSASTPSFFPSLSIPSSTSVTSSMKDEEEHVEEIEVPNFDCDATYESSFYSHFFFTGKEDSKVFVPRYSFASTINPFTTEKEYWMSVNFNSKYDGKGIIKHNGRPTINLVVALDISGSMSQAFAGTEQKKNDSKMKVAKDSLLAILHQLKPEDSFGLLVFNQEAIVIQPLTKWKETDTVKLEKDIMRLRTGGGTELTKALKTATEMYSKVGEGQHVSNRVFFLTDMEANYEKDGDEFADFTVKKFLRFSLDNSDWNWIGLDFQYN